MQTIEETRALWESNRAEVEATGAISASVSLRHAGIDRNRRCLLAYLNSRMEKMREMRWQFGAVLPQKWLLPSLCMWKFELEKTTARSRLPMVRWSC